ncbi:MAG: TIR domain-containing protein [Bacteroidetes bacterium]|nr:TIR domain-containing protein [Bacteroidota bacterium]MCL5026879.1 TIR domain-containing protein [Chloroflexota bacterium]
MAQEGFQYDVALSFAGEDREYVETVASILTRQGIRLFYDHYEQATLWGKDLYAHLQNVYQKQSHFTVMFVSEHYARKVWTNHERRSAQARAFSESQEYILPARFDDTEIPGLLPTIGYIDLRETSPDELANLIIEKLGLGKLAVGTTYSQLTNTELKRKSLSVVAGIRSLLDRYHKRQDGLMFDYAYHRSSATEEERHKAWNERNQASADASREIMSAYASEFKVEALLLRRELLHRLPIVDGDNDVDHLYEHPTNPLGIEEVVDDLERLAKSLPVS